MEAISCIQKIASETKPLLRKICQKQRGYLDELMPFVGKNSKLVTISQVQC